MAVSLAELWRSSGDRSTEVAPELRPLFLARALPAGRPPPIAARLRMHGEIRLKNWKSFLAEEVLHRTRGFVWKASVGPFIRGQDALLDGKGSSTWRLCGLIPVVHASGRDVDRSATGRWLAESLFLPSMLLPESGAVWEGSRVTLRGFGETVPLDLILDDRDRLREFRTLRWGNPDGARFGLHPFGGVIEEERTFDGVSVPSRLRVGWHFGTPRWDEGEFFRMTLDDAAFR